MVEGFAKFRIIDTLDCSWVNASLRPLCLGNFDEACFGVFGVFGDHQTCGFCDCDFTGFDPCGDFSSLTAGMRKKGRGNAAALCFFAPFRA